MNNESRIKLRTWASILTGYGHSLKSLLAEAPTPVTQLVFVESLKAIRSQLNRYMAAIDRELQHYIDENPNN